MEVKRKRRVALAAITALCLAFAVAAVGHTRPAKAEPPVFSHTAAVRDTYGLGYDLVISRMYATAGEDEIACGAILSRGGETVAVLEAGEEEIVVRLLEAGEYTLTYMCASDGKYYSDVYTFTVENIPLFRHSIASSYKLGDDVPLNIVASYNGESAPAAIEVDGEAVSGDYRVTSAGEHEIRMSAEFGGETYDETVTFTVAPPETFGDLFTGNAGLGEIAYAVSAPTVLHATDNPGGALRGVRVLAGSNGTVIRYGNIIDVSTVSKDGLISFIPLSGDGYTALSDLRVRLTDVYDDGNFIEWHMSSTRWGETQGNTTYCKILYDGVEHARFAESTQFGMPAAPNSYTYGATMSLCPMDCPHQLASGRSGTTRLIKFGLDYAERALYTYPVINFADPWLMLDLDDPDHVGGIANVWGGFTTGEAWLEITLDGSGNSGVYITSVAGQPVGAEEIEGADTVGPSIILGNAATSLPKGFSGEPYKIPLPVSVVDLIDGKLDIDSVAVEVKKGAQEVAVAEGAFTPAEEGEYTITYSAEDSRGNCGESTATVIVGEFTSADVTCGLDSSAHVGETVMLPAATVEGLSTLVSADVEYYYNGRKLDNSAGDYLFLGEEGTLEVRWRFVDYIGKSAEGSKEMDITVAAEPIITVSGMPTAAIRGNKLILPDFTAIDYNCAEGSAGRYPTRSITVNGRPVSIDERTYEVTAADGKQLDVVYGAGTASKTFVIKVVKAGLLSSYFTTESAKWVMTEDTADYTGFRFTDAMNISPINPTVVNAFTGFNVVFSATGAGTIKYTMTDIYREGKSIYVTIDLATRKLRVMDGETEYDLPDGNITVGYSDFDRSISGYDVLTHWADGMPFDGFKGGVARLGFELYGFNGSQQFRMIKLGMRNMTSVMSGGVPQKYNDSGDPTVITESTISGNGLLPGGTLVVPAASAWTALSGRCRLIVSLIGPDGKAVFRGLDASKAHTHIVDAYGTYRVQYTYTTNSGISRSVNYPVTVRPASGPEVTLLTPFPSEVAAGSEVFMPDYGAKGVGEITGYWLVCEPGGLQHLLMPGESVTFARAGTYRITLVVTDEFATTVKSYVIQAKR